MLWNVLFDCRNLPFLGVLHSFLSENKKSEMRLNRFSCFLSDRIACNFEMQAMNLKEKDKPQFAIIRQSPALRQVLCPSISYIYLATWHTEHTRLRDRLYRA